jgi:hypothetical protein
MCRHVARDPADRRALPEAGRRTPSGFDGPQHFSLLTLIREDAKRSRVKPLPHQAAPRAA